MDSVHCFSDDSNDFLLTNEWNWFIQSCFFVRLAICFTLRSMFTTTEMCCCCCFNCFSSHFIWVNLTMLQSNRVRFIDLRKTELSFNPPAEHQFGIFSTNPASVFVWVILTVPVSVTIWCTWALVLLGGSGRFVWSFSHALFGRCFEKPFYPKPLIVAILCQNSICGHACAMRACADSSEQFVQKLNWTLLNVCNNIFLWTPHIHVNHAFTDYNLCVCAHAIVPFAVKYHSPK